MPYRITSSGINYRDAEARARQPAPKVPRWLCGCRRLSSAELGPSTVAVDEQGVEVCCLRATHPNHQEKP